MEKPKRCGRCGNSDPAYFYLGAKGWYCRKCIGLGRFLETAEEKEAVKEIKLTDTEYCLPFQLTAAQKKLAVKLKECYEDNNVLIHAACGAGKTELMLDFISDALAKGYRLGWAIPRRWVVLQLSQRLGDYYPKLRVTAVCQGHTDITSGDLIVCTTHQLFRYYRFFDYLIIDEPDAYPFKDNEVLRNIALNSVRKNLIFLTATPDTFVLQNRFITLELFSRPHGYPLCVPFDLCLPGWLHYLVIAYLLNRKDSKILVFVPSIAKAESLYRFFSLTSKGGVLTSKSSNKEQTVQDFINRSCGWLISTTVLERGVTIPKIDVVVFQADSAIYDLAALIQMAGRVGRVAAYPEGRVWFLSKQKNCKVKECIETIKNMNKNA